MPAEWGADGPAPGEQAPIEGIPIAPAHRVAERLAARAEAAVRAPWKAAIAFARAAKREARGNAGQSGDGAARDLRNDPREERPGACSRDEAVVVGSPGDSSLPASPRRPTLVGTTQPGAAVRANWPLRDLRNDPPDGRPGACSRGEAAAAGSPGDSSLPASPRRPTLVGTTQLEAAVRAKWPLRDLRNDPPDERPGACPRGEAAAVGSPGDSSLPASPRSPTLVNATRAEVAVRANWPVRDLRNNPPDERSGACPGGEAAVAGLPGDPSLPASPCGPTLVNATRAEVAVRANWPWGGMKGRLCGTTISGGYKSGGAELGTWQAVLEASNAVEAGKSWTLLGSRLPLAGRNTGGWPV